MQGLFDDILMAQPVFNGVPTHHFTSKWYLPIKPPSRVTKQLVQPGLYRQQTNAVNYNCVP